MNTAGEHWCNVQLWHSDSELSRFSEPFYKMTPT
jgi:hypothetical protein